MKIKIIKSGPYIVTGGVPLSEKIITPEGRGYRLLAGRALPQSGTCALCRCGHSKNAPFCDGAHSRAGFDGTETATREPFNERAELLAGRGIDLRDDGCCSFSRFCHTNRGDIWTLAESAETQQEIDFVVKTAGECLAGRLVAVSKSGHDLEPELAPEICMIQDPEKGVSANIFVSGKIPIESEDGYIYEARNRVALCCCGKSGNKPFCDAAHINCERPPGQNGDI